MAVKAKAKSVTTMGYCVQDSREYPSDRFYQHKNTELFPKGLVPFCKDCCDTMFKYYLQKTGTLEASMWYVCARLDMPFIQRVFEKVQEQHIEVDKFVGTYYNYLWGSRSMKKALDTWEIRREKGDKAFLSRSSLQSHCICSLKFLDEKHKRPKKEESLA